VAKKQHHEEHENHERWLVSYADFITLLFAFFVVMYSISRVDNKRMAQITQAIKFAMHFKGTGGVGELPLFDGPPSEGGCVSNSGTQAKSHPRDKEVVEAVRRRLEKRLRDYLQFRPEQNPVVVKNIEGRRLSVRLSAAHFFDPSQAAIRPEMIPVLDAIAAELGALKRPVRIEGHTDESPVGSTKFRDNWELSASRAAAVAAYIQRGHRIDGRLLSASGHGSTRPLASNNTQEGREANRRVEMVVELNPGDPSEAIGR
jgi:chemotaxis protein MotB